MFWYKWSWLSSALFLVIVGVSGQMPGFSGIVYLDQARSNQPMTHDGAGTGRIFLVPYLVYRAPDPSPRCTLAKYQLRYTETRYLVWLLATCDSNGEIARCKHGVTIARLVQVHLTLHGCTPEVTRIYEWTMALHTSPRRQMYKYNSMIHVELNNHCIKICHFFSYSLHVLR